MSNRKRASQAFRREVGARLKERRLALNLSQEEVAWEADVAQGSISNYETGRNDIPLSVLVSICRAFGMSPVDIVPTLAEAPCHGLEGFDSALQLAELKVHDRPFEGELFPGAA